MDKLLEDVQQVFRGVFDQPSLVITRDSNAGSVEGWDSLTHISLLAAISKKYKIKLGVAEVEQLKNVGDLVDLIARKTTQTS